MTLAQVGMALDTLEGQLRAKGMAADTEYDEIVITKDAIRLRRHGKTLKVPLVEVELSAGMFDPVER